MRSDLFLKDLCVCGGVGVQAFARAEAGAQVGDKCHCPDRR